ncbi:MAG: ABC transporter permease subunit [Chloroflexota bacterium]|nr:ABC transporter permease subunit [Chloroflexota bacterium]
MDVGQRLWSELFDADFLEAIAVTVETSLIGLAIGGIAGSALAFILSERGMEWLRELIHPYLTFLNSTPRVVLVPFFILIFGIGPASRVALSVSLVFFVMFFGVFGAIQAVRQELIRNARVMGASRLEVWRFVVLPGALPGVVDTLQIAVSLAILGVVVGEIVTTPSGLGGFIRLRAEQYDLPAMFSGLLVLGALSLVATGSLSAIGSRLLGRR